MNPMIAYDNHAASATIAASSTATDYAADNVANPSLVDAWKPSALPGYLTFDLGADVFVDYVGIVGHELGSTGCAWYFQYSDNGSTWSNADYYYARDQHPGDDRVIFRYFDTPLTHRYWRLYISGSTAPAIAYVAFGLATVIPSGVPVGASLSDLDRDDTILNNVSETGLFQGKSLIAKAIRTSIKFDYLPLEWVRRQWACLYEGLSLGSFFYVPDYDRFAINYVPESDNLLSSTWTKTRCDLLPAEGLNGGNTAVTIVDDNTAASTHQSQIQLSDMTDSVTYTAWARLKYAGRGCRFQVTNKAGTQCYAVFDLQNGEVDSSANVTSSGIRHLGNSVYECYIVFTMGTGATTPTLYLVNHNGSGVTYDGDGASGVTVEGVQVNNSAAVKTYVPTAGGQASNEGQAVFAQLDGRVNQPRFQSSLFCQASLKVRAYRGL